MSRPHKFIPFALIALVIGAMLTGCGSDSGSDTKLSIVAYSTPQEAYKKLIPAFKNTSDGKGVSFSQSYGASGEQSRAVENGLKADVVEFSYSPDVDRLVKAGKVDKGWDSGPDKGIVSDSVVVFATRKGNPKNIKTWDDLLRKDVEVIAPNAVTSGGARWNLIAAYGQARNAGKSDAESIDFLRDLLANVSVQDKSARESLQTFTGGKGDVLLTYENEAITAQKAGQDVDYTIPDSTLLIENPVAVTNVSASPEKAKAFRDFLFTDGAQKIFAEQGYRPIKKSLVDQAKFPTPKDLFTVADFGGWDKLKDRFFEEKKGIVTKINEELGVRGQ
jgi:sulfate transport system substrate-binding protein